jgi:hypothetical protein
MAISLKKGLSNKLKDNKIKNNKKAFTYLLVTSFFVVVLLAVFFTTNSYRYQDQESMQQVRIRAMNDFVRNLNDDVHRATYISARRAMIALEQRIYQSGSAEYFPDIGTPFREAFFYGTINGTAYEITVNSTFSDYLAKTQELAQATGITMDINVTNVRMTQTDPWNINIFVTMNIYARDTKNTASWNISKEYVTKVPIEGMIDPTYPHNVPGQVNKFNITILVNGSNSTNLKKFIEGPDVGAYYITSSFAPNFLMRFEGNFSQDPDHNGIESIVNLDVLSRAGYIIDSNASNRVKVDYMYFNTYVPTGQIICNVNTLPSDFVIPLNRVNLYQINGSLNYSTTCP